MSQFDVVTALRVTERIDHANPVLTDYPLLPGDLLHARDDGTFNKIAPGLAVVGFKLTAEQLLTCEAEHVGIGPDHLTFVRQPDHREES